MIINMIIIIIINFSYKLYDKEIIYLTKLF